VLGTVLGADVALLTTLEAELARAEAALADILPATPAAVLTSLPGIGVVRASSYGAAIGDPWRFPNAAAAYRASGLVPTEYDSAGKKRRRGQHISREGSVLLREAIIELGKGLTGHHHDFAAYRRRLIDQDKKTPAVAAVAAGRRAHRLAFAMLRSQTPFDPARWQDSITTNQPASTRGRRPKRTTTKQSDLSTPPDRSRATPRTRRQGPGKTSR
jgi:transposase